MHKGFDKGFPRGAISILIKVVVYNCSIASIIIVTLDVARQKAEGKSKKSKFRIRSKSAAS